MPSQIQRNSQAYLNRNGSPFRSNNNQIYDQEWRSQAVKRQAEDKRWRDAWGTWT